MTRRTDVHLYNIGTNSGLVKIVNTNLPASPPNQMRIIKTIDVSLIDNSLTGAGRVVCMMGNGKIAFCPGGTKLWIMRRNGFIERKWDIGTDFGILFAKTISATMHPTRVVIADQTPNVLYMFDTAGSTLKKVWQSSTQKQPRGIAVDRQDRIWLSCKNGNTASSPGEPGWSQLFNNEGTLLQTVEIDFGARGVAIDSNDDAWHACLGDQIGTGTTVIKVDDQGNKTSHTVDTGPFGIVCDQSDNKFVACAKSDSPAESKITKIDSSGTVTTGWFDVGSHLSDSDAAPLSLGLDDDDHIWVTCKLNSNAIEIDQAGTAIQTVDLGGNDRPETLNSITLHETKRILFPGLDFEGDVPFTREAAKYELENPHPFIWLFEVILDEAASLRFTPYDEEVEFPEGSDNKFYPYPVEWEGFEEGLDGDFSGTNLRVSNADRQLQPHLDEYRGFTDLVCVVRAVHEDYLDATAYRETAYEIADCSASWDSVSVKLGASPLFSQIFPSQRYNRIHCRAGYKTDACGYIGPLPTCSHLLEGPNGCIAHGDDEVARGMVRIHPKFFKAEPDIPRRA